MVGDVRLTQHLVELKSAVEQITVSGMVSAARCKSIERRFYYTRRRLITCATSSSITPATPESSTELHVTMRQIQHRLWKTRCLHDTPHFDRPLLLDEFPDDAKQRW